MATFGRFANNFTWSSFQRVDRLAKSHKIVLLMSMCVVMALMPTATFGGTWPHASARLSAGYSEHPTVSKVRATGFLTVLNRERALSSRTPMDRGLAIVDATGASNARKYRVAKAMVRALRARHSLGPSGALLGRQITHNQLSARSALLLGWLKALTAKSRNELTAKGAGIRNAGALQLLKHAATKAPNVQAPHIALALVKASLAGKRGKAACKAWIEVQKQARNGRKQSIALAAAERAVRAVRHLRKACPKSKRATFKRPISLPAPLAKRRRPARAATRVANRPAGRPAKRSADVYGKGVAFSAVAPVFKGYMNVPEVRDIIRHVRLDQVKLYTVMKTDKSGDKAIAVINATFWSRRLPPERIAEVAWSTVLRRRNLLDSPRAVVAKLTVSKLTAVEAMVVGYGRVAAGWGLEQPELAGDPPAESAQPRQLFRHARGKLPMNATLGPIMAMLHTLDLQRQASLCMAAKRADSIGFVVKKSALPAASKRIVLAATDMIRAQCATVSGAAK